MTQVFETPNATMSTYASALQTGSLVAMWRVEMAPGASGPLHSVSNEQILVVTDGQLKATVGDSEQTLAAGDATILPAGVERRLANAADEPVVSLVAALSGGEATVPGKDPVPIPWAQ